MEKFENPLKTDGFAFVEFVTCDRNILHESFINLGFKQAKVGKNHDVLLYQQNQIKFFVNNCSDSFARDFYNIHSNSPCSMGFYVENPEEALKEAVKRGAVAIENNTDSIWKGIPAIEGIGGSIIYLVSRKDEFLQLFDKINSENYEVNYISKAGLEQIDHLTHNVYRGNMQKWADFYTNIFGFRQIRYFDIDGKITGLFSKAMTSACGKIKIPLNESKDDKSQIEEFLQELNGEGIQHIALTAKDIYSSIEHISSLGIKLLSTPDTYYELIDKRLPNHGEDIERLKKLGILIDGTTEPQRKLLLQIFTQNLLGPTFFEIIQRKGDEGFGEGNFQALFDSIELDQVRRGIL
ncbi:MAG TPA: 4-hydroxyphenylpyruvate dioxygenase [Burkholderiales bacterium]|nr:4-hydroxyphenylpyruvate dioxygenase [Burkholderiales bacterium]